MKILGLDQSYTSTGLVLLDKGAITAVALATSDPKDTIFDRAWDIATQIKAFVTTHKITQVYMEGLAFGMRGNATRDLAGLQFVVYTMLNNDMSIPVVIVTPSELKKHATGKGGADKKEMASAVSASHLDQLKSFRKLNAKQLTDVVDAYWLASLGTTRLSASSD